MAWRRVLSPLAIVHGECDPSGRVQREFGMDFRARFYPRNGHRAPGAARDAQAGILGGWHWVIPGGLFQLRIFHGSVPPRSALLDAQQAPAQGRFELCSHLRCDLGSFHLFALFIYSLIFIFPSPLSSKAEPCRKESVCV